jgi:ABC-type glutathione transport system ATPase component
MGEVAQTGRTIVLVSHQLNQIRRLCRLAIWLDAGQIRQAGPAAEVVTAYEAEMSMGGLENARPPQGRAQFLSWKLENSNHDSDHSLASDGPVTVSILLRANAPLDGVHLGILLYDQDRHPLWSRTMEGVIFEKGMHEIRYTLASLPLQPGPYVWRVGIYDSSERVDDWECMPQMQVVTVPFTPTRDDVAGVLNIPSQVELKRIE